MRESYVPFSNSEYEKMKRASGSTASIIQPVD
jgi:hypothetical protein